MHLSANLSVLILELLDLWIILFDPLAEQGSHLEIHRRMGGVEIGGCVQVEGCQIARDQLSDLSSVVPLPEVTRPQVPVLARGAVIAHLPRKDGCEEAPIAELIFIEEGEHLLWLKLFGYEAWAFAMFLLALVL